MSYILRDVNFKHEKICKSNVNAFYDQFTCDARYRVHPKFVNEIAQSCTED